MIIGAAKLIAFLIIKNLVKGIIKMTAFVIAINYYPGAEPPLFNDLDTTAT